MLSPRNQDRGNSSPYRAHLFSEHQSNVTLVLHSRPLIAISPTPHVRHNLHFTTIARPNTLGTTSICTVCVPEAITNHSHHVMPARRLQSPAPTSHIDQYSRVDTAPGAHSTRTNMESRLRRHRGSQALISRLRSPRKKHREVQLDKSRPS